MQLGKDQTTNSEAERLRFVALSLLFLLVLLCVSTQYLAMYFSYSPGLGTPVFGTLYSPLRSFTWSLQLAANYPGPIASAWLAGLASAIATVAVVAFLIVTAGRKHQTKIGHGSAAWATRDDIEKARLIGAPTNSTSLVIGGFEEPKSADVEYLVHTGPESVLLTAPSRSGKGVSLVIPNLLCFEESVFVLDVKGELWKGTAGYRRDGLGNKVLYHNPSSIDEGSARFNVLDEIRAQALTAVKDTQLIAEYLIPSSGRSASSGPSSGSENDHFETSARSLLVGVILYELNKALYRTGEIISVTHVLATLTDPELKFRQYLEAMQLYEETHCLYAHVINQIATEMQNREDREFSSVLSSMVNPLSIYRDPILADATSRSDFRLTDLVDYEKAVTLYMIMAPSEGGRLRNYFGMIVNLLCRKLTERLPDKDYKRHKLLLMLDEFSKLPPLPIVQDSLDHFAGYGIKAYIVAHDVQTLTRLYGQHETITSNCKVRIAFTPNKVETAEMLSKMIGTKTVEEQTKNRQRKTMSVVDGSVSEAEGLHGRPLITVDEIMQLEVPILDADEKMISPGATLVFVTGCRPIKGIQIPFFMDAEMLDRSKYPRPAASDQLSTDLPPLQAVV